MKIHRTNTRGDTTAKRRGYQRTEDCRKKCRKKCVLWKIGRDRKMGEPKGQSNNMKKPEIWRRANRAISATKQKMVKNEIEKRTITSIIV